jgi:hypothetical protein
MEREIAERSQRLLEAIESLDDEMMHATSRPRPSTNW